MLTETLSKTNVLEWPMLAFLIFLSTFVFVVVRVVMRGRKDAQYALLAQLPLDDDDAPVRMPRTDNTTGGPRHED